MLISFGLYLSLALLFHHTSSLYFSYSLYNYRTLPLSLHLALIRYLSLPLVHKCMSEIVHVVAYICSVVASFKLARVRPPIVFTPIIQAKHIRFAVLAMPLEPSTLISPQFLSGPFG